MFAKSLGKNFFYSLKLEKFPQVHVMTGVIFLFFFYPVNNALSPSRAVARKTFQFRQSHVIRSPPMKHIKRLTLTIDV